MAASPTKLYEGEEELSDEQLAEAPPLRFNKGERLDAVQKWSEYFTTCSALVILGAINDVAKDLVDVWAAFGHFCRTRIGVEQERSAAAPATGSSCSSQWCSTTSCPSSRRCGLRLRPRRTGAGDGVV